MQTRNRRTCAALPTIRRLFRSRRLLIVLALLACLGFLNRTSLVDHLQSSPFLPLSVKSSLSFYRTTGLLPAAEKECPQKRMILHNQATEEECQAIIAIASKYSTKASVGDEMYSTDLRLILAHSHPSAPELQPLRAVRAKLRRLTMDRFNDKRVMWEYMDITARHPGKTQYYSHGFHVDRCFLLDENTRECEERESSCCAWRDYTIMMYLNNEHQEFEGGKFVFPGDKRVGDKKKYEGKGILCGEEDLVVEPRCGTVVAFTTGPENVHGVTKVESGVRWAVAGWMTVHPQRREPEPHEWAKDS